MKETKSSHGKRNFSDLKSRLFEKGLNYSTIKPLKSPLGSEGDNRNLYVNLTSANASKNSPKILRKQISCVPGGVSSSSLKKYVIKDHIKTEKQSGDQSSPVNKHKNYFYETSKSSFFNDRIKDKENYMTFMNSLRPNETVKTFERTSKSKSHDKNSHNSLSPDSPHKNFNATETEEFLRTKTLMEKLSGKSQSPLKQTKPEKIKSQQVENNEYPLTISPKLKWHQKEVVSSLSLPRTLESYIALALKNEKNLQEFLYLVNRKCLIKSENEKDIESLQVDEDNPYDLEILPQPLIPGSSNINKQKEDGIGAACNLKIGNIPINKYYTVSKKGLCHYYNNKPVEFIELQDWLNQREIYEKIKSLAFFNKFKRWKIVKMWRKKVLKHRIKECSKNLEDKLFWLNPTMRSCLFQIRNIDLEIGKNMVIVNRNLGNIREYSLDHFKIVQEKTKREVAGLIEDYSRASRVSVNKCFEEVLRYERLAVKEKQQNQDKLATITSQINAKDAAFQALGFPPKMSYQNRSRLRKMAGNFIRFSYLIDMIHSAGLAYFFSHQLSTFIDAVKQAETTQPPQIIIKKEQIQKNNESQEQIVKMFNVKVSLIKRNEKQGQNQWLSDQFKNQPLLQQLCYDKFEVNQKETSKKSQSLCEQCLKLNPEFDEIYDELAVHIRQSLSSLKYFERWAKHRDMQRFINILEEWDDVVTESRQIADNENLDPVSILSSFDESLQIIKSMMLGAVGIIKSHLRKLISPFLNVYIEIGQIDLQKFNDEELESPPEVIELFLGYLTTQRQNFQREIPFQIKYGIFQINLANVKKQMIQRITDIYEEFKSMLPEIVQRKTKYLNDWLAKYNEVIKEEVKNIDDFVKKVKYIKEIDQTLQLKKELCHNLSEIYHTMDGYGLNIKKKKDFQTVTLKLKDQLEQQINTFQQTCERQSEVYLREITRNYFPGIIKDAKKLQNQLQNSKFYQKTPENEPPIAQLHALELKYEEIQDRNRRFCEYQLILNSYIADAGNQNGSKSLKSFKSIDKADSKKNIMDHTLSPIYTENLYPIKTALTNLILIWKQTSQWGVTLQQLDLKLLKEVFEEEGKEKLSIKVKQSRQLLDSLANHSIIPWNTSIHTDMINQLAQKVVIFQASLPIVAGFKSELTEQHWFKIIEIASRSGAHNLDLRNCDDIAFKDFIKSGIIEYKEELQEVFYKAKNEIALQKEYSILEEKWQNKIVKTKVEGKYHFISSDEEEVQIIQMFDQGLRSITKILANPFSNKLRLSTITYENLLYGLQSFKKYITIQHKYFELEKLTKNLDMKKLPESSILEQFDKHQKAFQKYIMQSRNIQNGFKLIKLLQPPASINISEKYFQESLDMLDTLAKGIANMVKEFRKYGNANIGVLNRLNDEDLLRVLLNSSHSSPETIESLCNKLLDGLIKEIVFTGQRITGLISYDDQSMIKTPISINTELEQVLQQIMDSITDVTRKTMRNCRIRSLESPSLLSNEICSEFNLQYLLAINKVDFSNYAAISIENRGENPDSVKEYLRILRKDTALGISKLKNAILNTHSIATDNKIVTLSPKAILNFQGLLLQNVIHQQILEEIVKQDIFCANDYSWINQLRFNWEDSGINAEESNIVVKKLHVSLKYGKEYIGSRTKVCISSDADMLLAIKFSEVAFFDGAVERIQRLCDILGHKLKIINCSSEQTSRNIQNIFNGYNFCDCFFFLKNPDQLQHKVWVQLLRGDILSTFSKKTANTMANYQSSCHNTTTNINYSTNTNIQGMTYNPVFLEFKPYAHSELEVYKSKFRVLGLAKPKKDFIDAHFKVYSWNCQINPSEVYASNFMASRYQGGQPKDLHNSIFTSLFNKRNMALTATAFANTTNKIEENSTLSQYIIDLLTLSDHFMATSQIRIQSFVQSLREKLQEINLQLSVQKKQKNEQNYEKIYVTAILQELASYLEDKVKEPYLHQLLNHISNCYENYFEEKLTVAQKIEKSQILKKISIRTGPEELLIEQIRSMVDKQDFQYINLFEHTESEIYGTEQSFGILDQIIFSQEILKDSYGASLFKEIVNCKQSLMMSTEQIKGQIPTKKAFFNQMSKIAKKINRKPDPIKKCISFKEEPLQKTIYIKGISQSLINYLIQINRVFYANPHNSQMAEKIPKIQILCENICQFLDPRILHDFCISHQELTDDSIDSYFNTWVVQLVDEKNCGKPEECMKKDREAIIKAIYQFYQKCIKSLWKNIYCKSQSTKDNEEILQKKNIITRFAKFVQCFLPSLPTSPILYKTTKSGNPTIPNPSPLTQLLCYSLIQAYSLSLSPDHPNYLKLQGAIKKLIGDERLKEQTTFYDYCFYQSKLVHLTDCYEKVVPEEKRIIERGRFFINPDFMHFENIIEKMFKNTGYGVQIIGKPWSGKSALVQSYRYSHFEELSSLKISLKDSRTKNQFYQRLSSIFCLNDTLSICPKLYYKKSIIIIEDVSLPPQNPNPVFEMIETMNRFKQLRVPYKTQKYRLNNCNMIMTSSEQGLRTNKFDDCVVKLLLGRSNNSYGPIQKIFAEVVKGNLMDSSIPDGVICEGVSLAMKVFEQTRNRLSDKQVKPDISVVKNICMFVSHLRFKHNESSLNEFERFWASTLKQNFIPFLQQANIKINELCSIKACQQFYEKSIVNHLLDEDSANMPLIYSHLHIKQQQHSIGKEVEIVKDLGRMENFINEKINKYNEQDFQNKRYGISFDFISIKQLIMKVIKMSNQILSGDYVIIGPCTQGTAIIKLVSHLMGFNYREKKSDISLLNCIRSIIPEITNLSSNLVSMSVTSTNISELQEFYDYDFQSEIACFPKTQIPKEQQFHAQSLPSHQHAFFHSSKLSDTEPTMTPYHSPTHTKTTLRELQNISRSIRIVYQFFDPSLLTEQSRVYQHIKNKASFDFFEEYPKESIIKFAQQILQVNSTQVCESSSDILYEIYQGLRKGFKVKDVQNSGKEVEVKLPISFKEYQESVRLYSYLANFLPPQFKNGLSKCKSMIAIYSDIKSIILRLGKQIQQLLEDKKTIQINLKKARDNGDNPLHLQAQQTQMKDKLQNSTQLKLNCEKIQSYLEPTMDKYMTKFGALSTLCSNEQYLLNLLSITASYITYLSKFPFSVRKMYLKEWYESFDALKKIPQDQRLYSISELFVLIREEEITLKRPYEDENYLEEEEFYENMIIVLQSIKPVLIKDQNNRGVKWLREFDESFIVVEENSENFYNDLSKYLQEGSNILISIKSQETLDGIQTGYLANLLEMSEGTPKVEINGVQIEVNRETKVYILLGEEIQILPEISSEFLQVTYQQSISKHQKRVKECLMMSLNYEKYSVYQETVAKIQELTSKLNKFYFLMAESIWREFYKSEENSATDQEKEEDFDQKKEQAQGKETLIKQKTQSEIIECVKGFKKSFFNYHSDNLDKLNIRKKGIPELQQKISGLPITPEIERLCSAVELVRETLNEIEMMTTHRKIDSQEFYLIISEAIKQEYLSRVGIFVMFAIKQWGQKYKTDQLLIFAWILLSRIGGSSLREIKKFIQLLSKNSFSQFEKQMRKSTKLKSGFLKRIKEKMAESDFMFTEKEIEEEIANEIIVQLGDLQYQNITGLCTIKRLPISKDLIRNKLALSKLNKNSDSQQEQLIDASKLLSHLIVFTGKIDQKQLAKEFNLRSLFNNTNTTKSLGGTVSGFNSFAQNGKSLQDLNNCFKRAAEQIENNVCMEFKNIENIESDMKKALNQKKNVYVASNYLTQKENIQNWMDLQNGEEQGSEREIKAINNDKNFLRGILNELSKIYDLYGERDKKNLEEKNKSLIKPSSRSHQGRNLRQSRAFTPDESKRIGVKFSQGISLNTLNGIKSEISSDFKIFLYFQSLKEMGSALQHIFGKNQVILTKIDIRDIGNAASNLLKTIYAKMQQSDGVYKLLDNSTKLEAFKERKNKKVMTLAPVQLSAKTLQSIAKTNKYIPQLQQQTIEAKVMPSFKHFQESSDEDYLFILAELLFTHMKEYLVKQNGENEDARQQQFSQYFMKGIEKIRQTISEENSFWNVKSQIFVLLKIFANISDFSNDERRSVSKRNIKGMKNWIKFIANLSKRLGQVFENTKMTHKESTLCKQGSLAETVLEITKTMISEDWSTSICGIKKETLLVKKQIQYFIFKNTWLSSIRRTLYLPPLEKEIREFDKSIFDIRIMSENMKKSARKQRASLLVTKNAKKILKQASNHMVISSNKKNASKKLQLLMQIKTELPGYCYTLQNTICQVKLEILKKETSKLIKIMKLDFRLTPEIVKYFKQEISSKILLNHSMIPFHWKKFLATDKPTEATPTGQLKSQKLSQKFDDVPALTSTLRDFHEKISNRIEQMRNLKLFSNLEIPYQGQQIDLEAFENPVTLLRRYLCKYQLQGPFPSSKISNQVNNPKTGTQINQIYLLTPTVTEEQMTGRNFIRIKILYAQGWKVGCEGNIELSQEEKNNRSGINVLNGMFIVKRKKIPQMALCELILRGQYYVDPVKAPSQDFFRKNFKEPGIKIYAYTKKLATGWKGELFAKKI